MRAGIRHASNGSNAGRGGRGVLLLPSPPAPPDPCPPNRSLPYPPTHFSPSPALVPPQAYHSTDPSTRSAQDDGPGATFFAGRETAIFVGVRALSIDQTSPSPRICEGSARQGAPWLVAEVCVCVCVVAVHRTSRCLLPRFKEGDLRSSVRLKMDLTRRGTHHHSGRHVLHHPRRRSQSVRSPRTSFIVHFVTGCLFEEIIIAKTDGWRG